MMDLEKWIENNAKATADYAEIIFQGDPTEAHRRLQDHVETCFRELTFMMGIK